jgi:hypothetical protein
VKERQNVKNPSRRINAFWLLIFIVCSLFSVRVTSGGTEILFSSMITPRNFDAILKEKCFGY